MISLQGLDLTDAHPGTYLHRVMSIGHRTTPFTRENVIGATSTSGFFHKGLYTTFDGVGPRSQATALETKAVKVPEGEWSRWGFSLPTPEVIL